MKNKHLDKYKYVGLNIAYYRKLKNLSQMQLAELVDISTTHMGRIETASACAASLDVIFDICDALEISPEKLFDFRK